MAKERTKPRKETVYTLDSLTYDSNFSERDKNMEELIRKANKQGQFTLRKESDPEHDRYNNIGTITALVYASNLPRDKDGGCLHLEWSDFIQLGAPRILRVLPSLLIKGK